MNERFLNTEGANAHDETIVTLNVGGRTFVTTTTTLQKDTKSMLYAMFSGKYPSKKDYHNAYFIDRDGKYFRYVLNFLRDGEVDLPDEPHFIRQVLREARFYQVEGLIRVVQEQLRNLTERKKMTVQGDYAVVYLGGYGNNAAIYTKDTEGGFTSSCTALNKLADKGYRVEGVASGPNGNYYAILRTDRVNVDDVKNSDLRSVPDENPHGDRDSDDIK